MKDHVLVLLAKRYPQLLMPIAPGTRNSEEYRDAVLCGQPLERMPDFHFSEKDRLDSYATPAGPAETLFLQEREDFEHALQALAHRCEPVEIPASIGANTLIGLNNWEKIRAHREEYLRSGGKDWSAEFRRFTADKSNYKDTLILLSSGEYSAVPASEMGLEPEEWKERSVIIRRWHELTHFVCRKLYPEDIDEIRDEVLADLIGSVAAFGAYDPDMARRFLGIEGGTLREGGRLAGYAAAEPLQERIRRAETWIGIYAEKNSRVKEENNFERMLQIFR